MSGSLGESGVMPSSASRCVAASWNAPRVTAASTLCSVLCASSTASVSSCTLRSFRGQARQLLHVDASPHRALRGQPPPAPSGPRCVPPPAPARSLLSSRAPSASPESGSPAPPRGVRPRRSLLAPLRAKRLAPRVVPPLRCARSSPPPRVRAATPGSRSPACRHVSLAASKSPRAIAANTSRSARLRRRPARPRSGPRTSASGASPESDSAASPRIRAADSNSPATIAADTSCSTIATAACTCSTFAFSSVTRDDLGIKPASSRTCSPCDGEVATRDAFQRFLLDDGGRGPRLIDLLPNLPARGEYGMMFAISRTYSFAASNSPRTSALCTFRSASAVVPTASVDHRRQLPHVRRPRDHGLQLPYVLLAASNSPRAIASETRSSNCLLACLIISMNEISRFGSPASVAGVRGLAVHRAGRDREHARHRGSARNGRPGRVGDPSFDTLRMSMSVEPVLSYCFFAASRMRRSRSRAASGDSR